MTKQLKTEPFYKGKLTGVYKNKGKKYNGYYILSEFDWSYMKIEDCVKLDDFELTSQMTADFWYTKIIRSKRVLPWQTITEIFIPIGEHKYYSGNIRKVLIKNIVINQEKSYFLQKDWNEVTADIYFQIEPPPPKPIPKPIKPVVKKENNNVSGVNIFPTISNNISTGKINEINSVSNESSYIDTSNREISETIISTENNQSKWATWFGNFFKYLFYAIVLYFLWKNFPIYAGIFLFFIVLGAIRSIMQAFPLVRAIIWLAILGFIGYFLYNVFYLGNMGSDPIKKNGGRIKVSPPKRTDDRSKGESPDYATEKEIQWFDFESRSYLAQYQTSQMSFDASVTKQSSIRESIQSFSSSQEFYTKFYDGLFKMDKDKIDHVVKIFSDSAKRNRMSPAQAAEMVTTFIQEIPYYLVHEGSCKQSVESGNDFLIDYHRDRKPCLPNISAGVQSPYEFLHNLKGDCDTRALLGFAILSKLKIGSSVWVSEAYGHSILGVAVPVGHGIYKNINGIKHYGVELTAKGFRLGMVAPEHARPNNWDITVYNNTL